MGGPWVIQGSYSDRSRFWSTWSCPGMLLPATAVPCFAETGFRFTLSAGSRVHGLRFRCLGVRVHGLRFRCLGVNYLGVWGGGSLFWHDRDKLTEYRQLLDENALPWGSLIRTTVFNFPQSPVPQKGHSLKIAALPYIRLPMAPKTLAFLGVIIHCPSPLVIPE